MKKKLCLIGILIISHPMFSMENLSEQVNDYYTKAEQLEAEGKKNGALDLYSKAVDVKLPPPWQGPFGIVISDPYSKERDQQKDAASKIQELQKQLEEEQLKQQEAQRLEQEKKEQERLKQEETARLAEQERVKQEAQRVKEQELLEVAQRLERERLARLAQEEAENAQKLAEKQLQEAQQRFEQEKREQENVAEHQKQMLKSTLIMLVDRLKLIAKYVHRNTLEPSAPPAQVKLPPETKPLDIPKKPKHPGRRKPTKEHKPPEKSPDIPSTTEVSVDEAIAFAHKAIQQGRVPKTYPAIVEYLKKENKFPKLNNIQEVGFKSAVMNVK